MKLLTANNPQPNLFLKLSSHSFSIRSNNDCGVPNLNWFKILGSKPLDFQETFSRIIAAVTHHKSLDIKESSWISSSEKTAKWELDS